MERFYPKAIAWRPHSRHKSSVSGGRQSTLLVFGLHPAPTGFGPISVRASTPSRHIASIQIQVQASRKGSLLPRLTNFTQADITRALRGATKAGMVVEKLTIGPDGGITLVAGQVRADSQDDWRARSPLYRPELMPKKRRGSGKASASAAAAKGFGKAP